jgi:hypothetical protein
VTNSPDSQQFLRRTVVGLGSVHTVLRESSNFLFPFFLVFSFFVCIVWEVHGSAEVIVRQAGDIPIFENYALRVHKAVQILWVQNNCEIMLLLD